MSITDEQKVKMLFDRLDSVEVIRGAALEAIEYLRAERDAALERVKVFGDALNDEVDTRAHWHREAVNALARAEKAEARLGERHMGHEGSTCREIEAQLASAQAEIEKERLFGRDLDAQLTSAQAVIDAARKCMDEDGIHMSALNAALAVHLERYPREG